MPRFRSLIAVFVVVLVQITPGPLGLRLAFAVAPPSTEWVTYSSSGGVSVMVRQGTGTDGVISPPSVDDATAKVSMPLDTGYIYQDSTTGTKRFVQSSTGGIMEVDLASGTAKQIVENDPSSYPKLAPILANSLPQQPITTPSGVGDVFSTPTGNRSILTAAAPVRTGGFYAYPGEDIYTAFKRFCATLAPVEIGGQRLVNTAGTLLVYGPYEDGYVVESNGNRLCYAYSQAITSTPSVSSPNPSPTTGDALNPGKVASGIKIGGFPGGTGLNGEIIQVGKKGAGTIVRPGGEGVLPEDIPLMPGYGGDAGDGAPVISDVPVDPTKDDSTDDSDAEYNPTPNGDPYPQDNEAINFGGRLNEFFTSAKQSAIFSLPSHFSDIPTSSTTVSTIDGGQLFGTLNFDFSSMAPLWVIIKSIVLTGFSFVSTRIVCLKR